MDELDYKYNHDARTQSPRLSAARLQQLSGDAGSDLETKKSNAPSARLSRPLIIREYAASISQSSCWALMLVENKGHVSPSGSLFAGALVSQRRLECSSPGPSEVHSARLLATLGTGKPTDDPSTTSASDLAQEARFGLHERELFLRSDQNLKLYGRICISINHP